MGGVGGCEGVWEEQVGVRVCERESEGRDMGNIWLLWEKACVCDSEKVSDEWGKGKRGNMYMCTQNLPSVPHSPHTHTHTLR